MMDYAFEAKQQEYREPVWRQVEQFSSKPPSMRKVVYLDTKQGLETRYLLGLGYSAENLFVVNRNPAEVACLTRNLKEDGLPLVNTYGKEFNKAIVEIPPVDVLSFDGTSNLHSSLIALLSNAVKVLTPKVITFTLMGGRETNEELKEAINRNAGIQSWGYRGVNQAHLGRICTVACSITSYKTERCPHGRSNCRGCVTCATHIQRMEWGAYMSTSKQPMVWSVAELTPHRSTKLSLKEMCFYQKYRIYPWCYMERKGLTSGRKTA
jgi:hypothetical protein